MSAAWRSPTTSARPARRWPPRRATSGSSRTAVAAYAGTLPPASPPAPDLPAGASDEDRAAFGLQLNAVNFGSGWFPTLRKPAGLSGFRTVEAGLKAHGPWSADALTRVDAAEAAATFGGQDPGHELMAPVRPRAAGAGRARPRRARRLVPRARAVRRGIGGRAGRAARRAADVARRVALRRRRGAVLQARPARRRRPAPAGHRAGRRRRRADAVRRQPRAARAADRRRAGVRARPRRAHRPRGAARARLARGGRDPRLRGPGRRAARRRAPGRHRRATAVDNVLWHRGAAPRYKAHPRHRARTTAY